MTLLCTQVLVSWDGDSLFTGPNDDVTADVAADPGVTVDMGKDGARTLDPPKVVACDFAVVNHTGKYSQDRPDSPVYQRVLPGRPVRVLTTVGESDAYRSATAYTEADPYRGAAVYMIASAAIDQISQSAEYGHQGVSFDCLGLEQMLVATTVTVGVMTAPRVDQCVTAILNAVGWPSGSRAISVSGTTLLYWWCDDREPWSALVELLLSEGPGAIYVDGAGVFHFEDRNYRTTTPRSTTSQAAYFDRLTGLGSSAYTEPTPYTEPDLYRGSGGGLYFSGFTYDPGFAAIRNRATYSTRQRVTQASGVVWTYGASFALGPGASTTLIARPSDPFVSPITPVGGTDYTVAGGTVSVSMSASSGLVAFLTFTATSGSPTVSGLQLRAQSLAGGGEVVVVNAVDASDSISKYSAIPGASIPRVFDVQGWPEIGVAYAQAVCDAWVTRYMIPRPSIAVTIEGGDLAHLREIFGRQISDRVTLAERNTGLSADVWINGKTIAIAGAGGRHVAATFRCERVEEITGSLWDDPLSTWDHAVWGR